MKRTPNQLARGFLMGAGLLLGAGCATSVETPQGAVADTNGRGTNLNWEEARRPAVAAKAAAALYGPIARRCTRSGGTLAVSSTTSVTLTNLNQVSKAELPVVVECVDGSDGPWGANLEWRARELKSQAVELHVLAGFRSAEEVARALADAAARRDAELSRKQHEREARRVAEAQAAIAEADRLKRTPRFQADLKIGDKVRARVGQRLTTGLVIAVYPPLAQVQFDNFTFHDGGSTRWIEISALEPAN